MQVSKNTVRHYVRIAKDYGSSLHALMNVQEKEFDALFSSKQNPVLDSREEFVSEHVDDWIETLRTNGVTRQLLWEEYRVEHPDGYGRSQFCEHPKRAIARRDLTLSIEHKAGEYMQLDVAGKTMHWIDACTGECALIVKSC